MTLKTGVRKRGGRRGRPKKHHPRRPSTMDPHAPHGSPNPTAENGTKDKDNKAKDEVSYKDRYPDLDTKAPIPILSLDSPPPSPSPHPHPTQQPSPKDDPADLTHNKLLDNLDDLEGQSSDLSSMSATPITLPVEDEEHPTFHHQKEGDCYQAMSTRPPSKEKALPKPVFHRIDHAARDDADRDASTPPAFERSSSHYLRYTEPSEEDLYDLVEYDMDEQDELWLNALNEDRRRDKLGECTPDVFEGVIDQLEKEWFNLIKSIPKPTTEDPTLPEDSACAICDDTECENSNAIVFCDGCNLAVHQDCYGIPYIPEGQWLCRKCLVSPENPVSCLFCPNEGGAFKQTNTNKWGHLLCAIWIPEVGLSNSVYMEPIDNISNIPKSRWRLTCYICRRKHGACIQCDNKHCFVAFHVTCARWARLCMRMKSHSSHFDGVVFKAYCDRHTPRDYRDQVNVEQSVLAAQAFYANAKKHKNRPVARQRYVDSEVLDAPERKKKRKGSGMDSHNVVAQLLPSSKAARAHQHHYSAGAPIAPAHIINKLDNLRCVQQANHLRKKSQLITKICRYWSLKRESRRGAPLLKRLHLEPWTASSSQHKQSEAEKAQRAAIMMSLRADLEKVRMLSEQVQKREKQKLERLRKQKAYLDIILFPLDYIYRPVVERLMEMDKRELFRYPVTPEIAPDYTDFIEKPMCFMDILNQFDAHDYVEPQAIEADVMLIWSNSMTYNKPETTYYKTAERLEKIAREELSQAREAYDQLELDEDGMLDVAIHPEIFSYNTVQVPSPEELAAEQARLDEERKEQERKAKAEARRAAEAEKRAVRKQKQEAEHARRREAYQKRRAAKAAEKLAREQAEAEAAYHAAQTQPNAAAVEAETETETELELEPGLESEREPKHEPSGQSISPPATRSATSQKQKVAQAQKKSPATSGKVTKRMTRSMGDLVMPTAEELRRKSSSEARRLAWHSSQTPDANGLKMDRKRKGPPGWAYLENSSEDEVTPPPEKRARTVSPPKPKPTVVTSYSHHLIVWARVKGFPPHPAQIVDPKKIDVSKRIMDAKQPSDKVLVEFFNVPDKHRWGWMGASSVFAFGDPEVDLAMLIQVKRTRNSRRIEEVRAGYRTGCKLMKKDPGPQLEAMDTINVHKKKR